MFYYRYKNCFFQKKENKDQAEAALLRLLKAEVDATPSSRDNSVGEEDVIEVPASGLAGVLQQLRQKGSQARVLDGGGVDGNQADEAFYIKDYLDSKLETVACLKYWEQQEKDMGSHRVKAALCRLARYIVVMKLMLLIIYSVLRKFLTPPPTSTDVERLFSIAGLIASDNRNRLNPHTLEKLLFLRENILVFNFQLDWD